MGLYIENIVKNSKKPVRVVELYTDQEMYEIIFGDK